MKLHSDITNICGALHTLAAEYEQEFSALEARLAEETAELNKQCQQDVRDRNHEAAQHKHEVSSERKRLQHLGEGLYAKLKRAEEIYAGNDAVYTRRRENGGLAQADSFRYPYSGDSEPLEQLSYISRRLEQLIRSCTEKAPPRVIRELTSVKGTRRNQAYAEMSFLVKRARRLMELLDRDVAEIETVKRQIDAHTDQGIAQVRTRYQADEAQLQQVFRAQLLAVRQDFEQRLSTLLSVKDLDALDQEAADCVVSAGSRPSGGEVPSFLCAGSLEYEVPARKDQDYIAGVLEDLYGGYVRNTILVLPLLMQCSASQLLFIDDRDEAGRAAETMQGLVCRYLAGMPTGSVTCRFIDGYRSGANFRIYAPLNEADSSMVPGEAATSGRQINETLARVLAASEQLVQRKLPDGSTLCDFNREAGRVAERYTLLAIDNFPAGFDADAMDKLERILIQSEKCGVSVIINCNEQLCTDPCGDLRERMLRIRRLMSCQFHADGVLFPESGEPCTLHVWNRPRDWDQLLQRCAAEAADSKNRYEPLEQLLTDDEELFSRSSRDGLVIPFGSGGPGKVRELVLGSGVSQSGLVVGTTGSGKSTLLHSIILSAIAHYGPEELSLYLMDFKEGMEFSVYADNPVPQVKFVSVESQQELGLSLFGRLLEEMKQRSRLFKAAGVQNISLYRRQTGRAMPRILVIIDEFYALFHQGAGTMRVADQCAERLKLLVNQGRAYGIHLLMAAQAIAQQSDLSLDPTHYAQMAVRIALKCDDRDAEAMFDVHPEITKKFGSVRGAGAYAADPSRVPEEFVTAFMEEPRRVSFLQGVSAYYAGLGIGADTSVYDGSRSVYFRQLLEATDDLRELIQPDEDYKVVLGESMGTTQPVSLTFSPRSRNNLLLVTGDQERAEQACSTFVHCLLTAKSRDPQFGTLDPFLFLCENSIRSRHSGQNGLLAQTCAGERGIRYSKTDRGLVSALRELYSICREREEQADELLQPMFLMLFGLHNMDEIMDTLSGDPGCSCMDGGQDLFSEEESLSPGELFRFLLEKGPRRGVHIIAWMDGVQSAKKFDSVELDHFGSILAGRMSGEESEFLIDSSEAGHITETQLLYADRNRELQKLKLYQ